MTNYNDGKWHGWNGGECPVHPMARVIVKWSCNGVETHEASAKIFSEHWNGKEICAFRVVKEHKEPREFWLYRDVDNDWNVKNEKPFCYWDKVIHVREVIE